MHVAARLVAADEDQQALLDDRLVVELFAVDLGLAQDADEVVLRGCARRSAITPSWNSRNPSIASSAASAIVRRRIGGRSRG